ncbi:MAG: hypothetical protein LBG60_09875 [Bifidobacteriaceae bacterium]|nr:hypothetical protein [Bifidobacteriaceae bacterium]
MVYQTLRGHELSGDHEARRLALVRLAEPGPDYDRAAADGLARLRHAWDVVDVEAALCEGERRTAAETKIRLAAARRDQAENQA